MSQLSPKSIVAFVSALALIALIAGILRQRPAPGFHEVPLGLPGGVPGTMYYQDPPAAPPDARPGIERPASGSGPRAAIVIAHGFAGDHHTMEGLARSLAGAGYTVVSLDMSGHGMNRNPLTSAVAASEQLVGDIRAGVGFLTRALGFEPARIAVLGHSMGSRATVDYGSRETGIGGLVMLSGSTDMLGPERPRNALFLYAEHDLPGIERSVTTLASGLAQASPMEQRKTYGDFSNGTAVRMAQIPGVAHGTILSSPIAYAEIVSWLDQVTGLPARSAPPALVKNPLGPPLLWLAFFLVLPGLGLLLGRLAPDPPATGGAQLRWPDLAMLPVALLLPLPFIALGRPGVLLGMSTADANVTHLALAGVSLLVSLILLGRLRNSVYRLPAALAVAATGGLAVSVLLGPASNYFHGVSLTPEKAFLTVWTALCLAPFTLAIQTLLYRPRWWRGTLLRLSARIAVLASVAIGNALGVFGFPGTIAVFVLIASFALIEPVLAGFYGRSRNVVAAAGFDAIVTGWLFALYLPTTL